MSGPSIIPDDRLSTLMRVEIARYNRHLLLPEVGLGGRRRLKAARVLLIDTGGLGAPMALYLAAVGVGKLGIADFNFVDISSLQRQIIHSTKDTNRPKVAPAKNKTKAINPKIQVETCNTTLNSKSVLEVVREYDLVIDGTNSYPIRYLTSDVCMLLGRPLAYGSVFQLEGQVSVFYAGQGPYYRCLYSEPSPPGLVPSCAENGVVGVLSSIIDTIQATGAIRLIAGGSKNLVGRLLLLDVWQMKQRELRLERDPDCPVRGEHPSVHALVDYEEFYGPEPDESEVPVEDVTALELHTWVEEGKPLQLIDIREPHERVVAGFPQAEVMPLSQIVRCIDEFDPTTDVVFLCKIGRRSISTTRILQRAGHQGRTMNLEDGLNAWARNVSTCLPQY